MHIRGPKDFPYGYNEITTMDNAEQGALMDFGILRMKDGDVFCESQHLERVYLFTYGKATVEFDGKKVDIERPNCFDYDPWVLHVPNDVEIRITAHGESEWCVHRTDNEKTFTPKLYTPEECRSEQRGKGTMREASTRIVRTVFDQSNAPYSNFVIGEVIGYPGKWSSYPPHNHPQPEVYFYKFNPENGYGFAELDEDVIKTHQNSTVLITKGETHPQTTAPGYAMWYLWTIRNLDGNPYITPYFIPEHLWVTKEENEKKIWPPEA
ncbi:MAG: 5-deoxy-glucuronate isomerase [Acutalibacteraceae bacterium]